MISLVDVPLALSAGITAIIVLAVCALVILVFLVIAPWRTVQDEPPIPEDLETRLLLGEDFDSVDAERDDDTNASTSVLELDRHERHE